LTIITLYQFNYKFYYNKNKVKLFNKFLKILPEELPLMNISHLINFHNFNLIHTNRRNKHLQTHTKTHIKKYSNSIRKYINSKSKHLIMTLKPFKAIPKLIKIVYNLIMGRNKLNPYMFYPYIKKVFNIE
jgi:hypothetical protein